MKVHHGISSSTMICFIALAASGMVTSTLGQQMRFVPRRTAPGGSAPGTWGTAINAVFKPALNGGAGCWEYRIPIGGEQVQIILEVGGWGSVPDAAGDPTELGAVQGTMAATAADGFGNGFGGNLVPLGWPGEDFWTRFDGAYQEKDYCAPDFGGDGRPCVSPFAWVCPAGVCIANPAFFWPFGNPVHSPVRTTSIDYSWASAVTIIGGTVADDGTFKTFGTLVLEVPTDAAGTYVIAYNEDQNRSGMVTDNGTRLQGIQFTAACITIPLPEGRCCSNIGPDVICEDGVTEQDCATRAEPRQFAVGESCDGGCACPTCLSDTDCDNGNVCTVDSCDGCGQCVHAPIFSVDDECCNPSSAQIVWIDDDDACTTDTCDPSTGQVSHADLPDCISFDADAFPKNRYISFETGVLAVELAFHVRMTASAHFPESIGDLGWVGAPDSKGTALVVPDPVFLPSWPAVVRAGDCEIVPAATYEIRATGDGVNFDPPIVVATTAQPTPKFWGDIVGEFNGAAWTPPNGVQNIADVFAAVKTYQGGEGAAPLIWADVEPETPNRVANFNDVFRLILAFADQPYPFRDPADCP